MNYYPNEISFDSYEGEVADLGYAETVGSYYEEQAESTLGALTIKYIKDFSSKVLTALVKIEDTTKEQFNTLLKVVLELHLTEIKCGNCLTKNVNVVASVENEFCFYRKTEKGVSMLVIDVDGDILFNFTGYNEGFVTKRSYYDSIDHEKIIYDFLSF